MMKPDKGSATSAMNNEMTHLRHPFTHTPCPLPTQKGNIRGQSYRGIREPFAVEALPKVPQRCNQAARHHSAHGRPSPAEVNMASHIKKPLHNSYKEERKWS